MTGTKSNRLTQSELKKNNFLMFLAKPVKKSMLYSCMEKVVNVSSGIQNKNTDIDKQMNTNDSAVKNLRILLAEDNKINQKVAKNMLKKMGHSVIIANNGREAVDIFKKSHGVLSKDTFFDPLIDRMYDSVDLVDFLKLTHIMRCIPVSNHTICCGLHVCLVVNQQTHV